MSFPRASGILLHPTSLPGPHGIGDLGADALRFVDLLADAGQTIWQVLPLGPTGFADSPYQSFSTFAGNPLLLGLDLLVAAGWLTPGELEQAAGLPAARVDFGAVIRIKGDLLGRAAARFLAGAPAGERDACAHFRTRSPWLDGFALFMALKEAHGGAPWSAWDPSLAMREPAALERAREALAAAVERHAVLQFFFATQWQSLKAHAARRGVRIFGDLPIFVAYDSADVWQHPELFQLDREGRPTVVAGVPPDLFSETGQRWGNPLYRWDVMRDDGFRWWVERLRHALALVDLLRIDHFIGFTRCWEIPADSETATVGRWVEAPGAAVLDAARAALGAIPIVAEDLGAVTPEVDALREQFALPGMNVLQFAFDSDATNRHLPHNHTPRSVVYTGTHDNDTAIGWLRTAPAAERARARRYLDCPRGPIAWPLIRAALASVADTAIMPLQDVLELGSAARMNHPGQRDGNWTWRFTWRQLSERRLAKLCDLTALYGRASSGERK
jgi:4-alpha-glucanotransferase